MRLLDVCAVHRGGAGRAIPGQPNGPGIIEEEQMGDQTGALPGFQAQVGIDADGSHHTGCRWSPTSAV